MQKTFTFYSDPAHGWVKASKALLKELGIADLISSYSYERGGDAFLEEDCDASLLVRKLQELGIEPKFVYKYADRNSKIRGYNSYTYLSEAEENELADLKLRMRNYTYWNAKTQRQINKAGLRDMKYWQSVYNF